MLIELPLHVLTDIFSYLPWNEVIKFHGTCSIFRTIVLEGEWCRTITNYCHLSAPHFSNWLPYLKKLNNVEGEFRLHEILQCLKFSRRHLTYINVRLLPVESKDILSLPFSDTSIRKDSCPLQRLKVQGSGSTAILFLCCLSFISVKIKELEFIPCSFDVPTDIYHSYFTTTQSYKLVPQTLFSWFPLWVQLFSDISVTLKHLAIFVVSEDSKHYALWKTVFSLLSGKQRPFHLDTFQFFNVPSYRDIPQLPHATKIKKIIGIPFRSAEEMVLGQRFLRELYGSELYITASSISIELCVNAKALQIINFCLRQQHYQQQQRHWKNHIERSQTSLVGHTAPIFQEQSYNTYTPIPVVLKDSSSLNENALVPVPNAFRLLIREGFLSPSSEAFVGSALQIRFSSALSTHHVRNNDNRAFYHHLQIEDGLHIDDREFFDLSTEGEWEKLVHFPGLIYATIQKSQINSTMMIPTIEEDTNIIDSQLSNTNNVSKSPFECQVILEKNKRIQYLAQFIRLLQKRIYCNNIL